MLPSLKKSGKKTEVDPASAWHPNFRNSQELPDTKTVRTDFFINIVVIAITLALLIQVALREFKLSALSAQLADIEEQVSAATKPSSAAVATYRLFQAEEKVFNEAYAFVSHPFRFSDFLVRLGEVLSPGVKIKRVDFKGPQAGLVVAASMSGLDAKASDEVSAFVEKVRADVLLCKDFPVVTLTGLSRSVADEAMNFELSFAPKPVVKPAAKGGAAK